MLAQANIQQGNTSAALKALHRSLRLAGDNAEVLFNAALIYALAKQWPVSLSYIEQSLAQQLSPIWFNLPWFDALCETEKEAFENLLAMANKNNSNTSTKIKSRCKAPAIN